MSIHIDCLSHIPGVRLQSSTPVIISQSSLLTPTFDEWLTFEDPAVGFHQNRYERIQPIFLHRQFELEGEVEMQEVLTKVYKPFSEDVQRLSHAILFTLWNLQLPDPLRSVTYFRKVETGENIRLFGINERELLFIPNDYTKILSTEDIGRIITIVNNLTKIESGERTPEILRAIDALRISTEPSMMLLDFLTNFVAVHENILNRAAERPLGRTFARRTALLYCPVFEQLPAFQQFFETMYNVRSDVLHGRNLSVSLEELNSKFSNGLYPFLILASYQMCCHLAFFKWQHGTNQAGLTALVSELNQVSDDEVGFYAFKQSLYPSWLEL